MLRQPELRRCVCGGAILSAWLAVASLGVAQGPPGPPPSGDRPGGDRPEGGGGPPTMPLVEALDTNRDGVLSADEIKAAAESLKKLDKNHDGKLSADELGWPPRFGGFGPGGPGGPGGFGPGGPGGPGGPRGGESSRRTLAQRIMERDANRDGKVTLDELPRSMQALFKRADTNRDGAIDAEEAERFGASTAK